MDSWRKVWREGVVPFLTKKHLQVLKVALETDDRRLIQGATTTPPPLQCIQEWPVEAACPFGFMGWIGDNLETVGEVEQFFAELCFNVDQKMQEPAACRFFLNWVDDAIRDELLVELLKEVNLSLGKE